MKQGERILDLCNADSQVKTKVEQHQKGNYGRQGSRGCKGSQNKKGGEGGGAARDLPTAWGMKQNRGTHSSLFAG